MRGNHEWKGRKPLPLSNTDKAMFVLELTGGLIATLTICALGVLGAMILEGMLP